MLPRFCHVLPLIACAALGCAAAAADDDAPEPPGATADAPRPTEAPADTVALWRAVLPETGHENGGGGGPTCNAPQRDCPSLQHWDLRACACVPNASCRPEREASCPKGFVCVADVQGCPASADGQGDCLGICMQQP